MYAVWLLAGYGRHVRRMRETFRPLRAMRSLIQKFWGSRLTVKVVSLFLVLLVFTLALAFGLFRARFERQRFEEFNAVARQNVELIASSIDAMIDNASYASKMLLSNETLQTTLIRKELFSSPPVMRTLTQLLSSFTGMQPHMAGLYLFDVTGQQIGVDNYSSIRFSFSRVEEAPWYPSVLKLGGYYSLMLNAGEQRSLFGSENVISLVRSVYNLTAQSELLGTLMLNLRESFLTSCFQGASTESGARITVTDGAGQPLLSGDQSFFTDLDGEIRKRLLDGGDTVSLIYQSDQTMVYCSAGTRNAPWRVVTAIPFAPGMSGGWWFTFRMMLVVLSLFITAAAAITVILVTRPLHRLGALMGVRDGHPVRVQMETRDDEIGHLKDTYNDMVDRIERLIARIEDESRRKREAEMRALQAQINPHFLYNTIDTARALALSGDREGLNVLLRSLGEFYRNSINSGREIITIGEEIAMVRSYLAIQRIRYASIEAIFDTDPDADPMPMPKLVIQPLVENAIYHGLRPAGNQGIIRVSTWHDEKRVYVRVTDDGAGISEAARLAAEQLEPVDAGFGLKGTLDRLKLFYGEACRVEIENIKPHGTAVTISIDQSWRDKT